MRIAAITAALVALGLAVTSPASMSVLAIAPQSPERLWEAFPVDPEGGRDGLTLRDPPPLPEDPPATPAEPIDAPAAAEPGTEGFGLAVTLAIVAAVLTLMTALAFGLRARRGRPEPTLAPISVGPRGDDGIPDPEPIDESSSAAMPETGRPAALEDAGPIYDAATCLEFVSGLSDDVLRRAIAMFGLLSRHGSADSTTIAHALGANAGALPGLILTPLRRRADELDLPSPYLAERNPVNGRRRWKDRDGVSGRLCEAALAVQAARGVTSARGPETTSEARREQSWA